MQKTSSLYIEIPIFDESYLGSCSWYNPESKTKGQIYNMNQRQKMTEEQQRHLNQKVTSRIWKATWSQEVSQPTHNLTRTLQQQLKGKEVNGNTSRSLYLSEVKVHMSHTRIIIDKKSVKMMWLQLTWLQCRDLITVIWPNTNHSQQQTKELQKGDRLLLGRSTLHEYEGPPTWH